MFTKSHDRVFILSPRIQAVYMDFDMLTGPITIMDPSVDQSPTIQPEFPGYFILGSDFMKYNR